MITREPIFYPPPPDFRGRLGRRVLTILRGVGRAIKMLGEAVLAMRFALAPRPRRAVVLQMYAGGIRSLSVVTVVATFVGMILALQTGLALRDYGQEVVIGGAVMISMLREMGPVFTGLILAASAGSAIAAEMGTMTVNEEIAGLELMAIDPVKFLVMPRLLALAIMTPLLSFYSVIMGVLGGGIVGFTQLDVAWSAYMDNAISQVDNKDLFVGMLKAMLFGVVIVTTACHQGFAAVQGAVGVGNAARRTVIISFLLILILGYMVTRAFYV
jgi:phospholipid/cholesterol/gamma-HCH transport system permease protein